MKRISSRAVGGIVLAVFMAASVAVAAPVSASAALMTAKFMLINRSDHTLRFDKANSRIYSRTDNLDTQNTAVYTAGMEPLPILRPGIVTDVEVTGTAAEGLVVDLIYRDKTNAGQVFEAQAHMHAPPHGNWINGWGVGTPTFVVDWEQTVYDTYTIGKTLCIYNPGTKPTEPCSGTP